MSFFNLRFDKKDLGGSLTKNALVVNTGESLGAFRGDDGINRFRGLCVCFVFAAALWWFLNPLFLVSSVVERPAQALKKGRKNVALQKSSSFTWFAIVHWLLVRPH